MKVIVIGAGLAGVEASYYLAQRGIKVVLFESKRVKANEAQKSTNFAELVCTNSLKSKDPETPHGLMKKEMALLGSLILKVAEKTAVPAGRALAVDRVAFSQEITEIIGNHPLTEICHEVVSDPLALKEKLGASFVVVATGPLTLPELEGWIGEHLSRDDFYFYDAIAPVVDADTLDFNKLYFKDRYQEVNDGASYLNAPLNREEYLRLVHELAQGTIVPPKDFEKEIFFESCLPVDVMAKRGIDTLRFSCMKPVGLETPDGKRPYAVLQMRKENLLGHAYNLVGLQTRLTYGEQKRIFRLIPGLEEAEFVHLGSVHRNSFLNAKKLLSFDLSSQKYPFLHFAGQMTGVEGYTESAMCGLYVAYQIERKLKGVGPQKWPLETTIGALINYLMTAERPRPTNINFGIMPDVELSGEERRGKNKKSVKRQKIAKRTSVVLNEFWS